MTNSDDRVQPLSSALARACQVSVSVAAARKEPVHIANMKSAYVNADTQGRMHHNSAPYEPQPGGCLSVIRWAKQAQTHILMIFDPFWSKGAIATVVWADGWEWPRRKAFGRAIILGKSCTSALSTVIGYIVGQATRASTCYHPWQIVYLRPLHRHWLYRWPGHARS